MFLVTVQTEVRYKANRENGELSQTDRLSTVLIPFGGSANEINISATLCRRKKKLQKI